MSPVALFPDVEKLVVYHLMNTSDVTDLIDPDRIVTDIPDPIPGYPLCRVRRWGGPGFDSDVPVMEATSLQVDVWGTSRATTRRIAATMQAVLLQTLVGQHDEGSVKRVRCTGFQYLPDANALTNLGKPRARYLFNTTVTTRVPRGG